MPRRYQRIDPSWVVPMVRLHHKWGWTYREIAELFMCHSRTVQETILNWKEGV